jgi:membrane protein YqaA with SNARE-associated domain
MSHAHSQRSQRTEVAKIYEDRFMAHKSSFMNFESIVLSPDLCQPWGSVLCAFWGSLRFSGRKFMAYRLTGSAASPSGTGSRR